MGTLVTRLLLASVLFSGDAIKALKMNCYIIFSAIVALTVSHAEEVEIVETREKCRAGTGSTGPICMKEVLKREMCRTGAAGRPHCKRIEDEEHEIIEARETCRPGTGSTGPHCSREVLRREACRAGTGSTGPSCNKEVLKREACRPGAGGSPHCTR